MSDMAMKYEDWLRGCVHHDGRKGNVYLPCDMMLAIADWIEAHRDVAPVRHAHWEPLGADEWGRCSWCGCPDKKKGAVYCRHCGAIMDGGELNDNAE